jgi:dipeptidyl aminopeptidase/acylaminoacyl peptidase
MRRLLTAAHQLPPPDQYLTVGRAYQPVPLPGGGIAFASDLAGHPNLYRLDRPGSWPARLAGSSNRCLPVGSTAAGFLYRHDEGGNETWQLTLLEPSGSLRRLTTDARAIHRSATLSPGEGRLVGFAYNPDGQDDFVLATIDLESGLLQEWARPGGYVDWDHWHPSGREASVIRVLGSGRTEGNLLRPGEDLRRVLPGAHSVHSLGWTSQGRLLALTDLDSEWIGLAELDPGDLGRPARWLLHPDQDVEVFVPSPDGSKVAAVVRDGFYQQVVVIDLQAGGEPRVLGLPRGVLYADNSTRDAEQLAWDAEGGLFVAWETPTTPAEIFEVRRATGVTQWTFAGPSLPDLRDPTETSYASFDGLPVAALHYRVDDRPRPAVVLFHGGPESQVTGSFNPSVQLILSRGIDVFAPNVRGSSGYGVTFLHRDDRELRWDSVRDGCEAARYLKREGLATRTAAMGGSYGGFMTLGVLVEDPGLWDAAVDIVGIADWHSFFENTSGWRRAIRASEYGDPSVPADAEFLAAFSPLRRAHLIRAPLLVLHGRNDVRVPLEEAEQIVAATGAELMIFDDEGHGLVKHANRVRGYGRATDFLAEKLGAGDTELA